MKRYSTPPSTPGVQGPSSISSELVSTFNGSLDQSCSVGKSNMTMSPVSVSRSDEQGVSGRVYLVGEAVAVLITSRPLVTHPSALSLVSNVASTSTSLLR